MKDHLLRNLVVIVLSVGLFSVPVFSGSFEDLIQSTYVYVNLKNYVTTALPAAATGGRIAYDTTVNQPVLDTGSAWRPIPHFSAGTDVANGVWGGTGTIIFEGATADAFEGTIAVADINADRTWTFNNVTGNVAIVLTGSATVDFASTAATVCSADSAITVTNAAVGDSVLVGTPATVAGGSMFQGYVSAADTVQIKHCNMSAAAVDPASATYKVHVFKAF